MDFIFAYGAGLLTLINPCVLPVVPIVLAAATRGHRAGPVALAAGMALTFVALGLFVTVAGASLALDETTVAQAGAVAMAGFGLVLLLPGANRAFALAAGGLASGADRRMHSLAGKGLTTHFLGGALLGAVWSPCVGPTLGGAIALAYQGQALTYASAIMAAFALGVATVMLLLGYGAQSAIRARAIQLQRLGQHAPAIMGWALLLVGLAILTGTNHTIEAWALDRMPVWLQDLSVSL